MATGVTAASLALEAVRLCSQGQDDQGAALYRQALAAPGGYSLPVGLHGQLLETSGHVAAAQRIRSAGRRVGADLSSCPLGRKGDLREGAVEYRTLFEQGLVNAHMVANYMICLSRIGSADELAAMAAPEILFRTSPLSMRQPVRPLLQRVIKTLCNAEQRESQAAHKSIRDMDRVLRTHESRDPDLAAIHSAVLAHVLDYAREVKASGHILGRWLPTDFKLNSWAVISEGSGRNLPHLHPGCWVVAVLYVAGDDDRGGAEDDAGWLRVGPGVGGDPHCSGWPDCSQAPTPGTLVLMPAFYTHWTVPLRRPGLRISIAFNASEKVRASDPDARLAALGAER